MVAFNINDLKFILAQIEIAEANATTEAADGTRSGVHPQRSATPQGTAPAHRSHRLPGEAARRWHAEAGPADVPPRQRGAGSGMFSP